MALLGLCTGTIGALHAEVEGSIMPCLSLVSSSLTGSSSLSGTLYGGR